jgi:hypothetical protein
LFCRRGFRPPPPRSPQSYSTSRATSTVGPYGRDRRR